MEPQPSPYPLSLSVLEEQTSCYQAIRPRYFVSHSGGRLEHPSRERTTTLPALDPIHTLDHPSGRSLPRPITRVETSRWHPGPPSARFLESGVHLGPELTAVSECPAFSRVLARLSQQTTDNS